MINEFKRIQGPSWLNSMSKTNYFDSKQKLWRNRKFPLSFLFVIWVIKPLNPLTSPTTFSDILVLINLWLWLNNPKKKERKWRSAIKRSFVGIGRSFNQTCVKEAISKWQNLELKQLIMGSLLLSRSSKWHKSYCKISIRTNK